MTRDRSRDIAVTGVSARFPGCADLDAWWQALCAGRVLTTRYARADLLAAGVPADLVDDPDYVPVRGHLDGAEHFDNDLFHVSPREARLMDPQHRLMLEAAWSALEDAAVPPLGAPGRTAVYASATGSGYLRAVLARGPVDPGTLDDLVHGSEPDFMASRVAYKLGLTGPALAVQTACSSSLVAVHLAVRALRDGDCDRALVLASGFDFPQAGYVYLPGGVHSPSGSCRPFDADADGVVSGSGVVCLVLTRLAEVRPEDPPPYGVILGTAVNNDGAAKVGYYAPSVDGQRAVIESALRAAGVDAASIGYLETHGTGTRIGDPIEWAAASAALRGGGAGPGQVAIGALKANVGHLDAAAGAAGILKTLFVLGHGVVPPLAGFSRANPLLDLDGSPLAVPTEASAWPGPWPRRAAVSAFGIGGTNAHVIVEQAPAARRAPTAAPAARTRLVVLSAADRGALDRDADRLAAHLAAHGPGLADVCATLATGRAALPYRLAVTGASTAEVAERLRTRSGTVTGHRPGSGRAPVVFLLPGQGTQHPGMALPYRSLPGFDEALRRCLGAFPAALSARVRRGLLDPGFPAAELDQTALAQPALFAVGWSAAQTVTALGIHPAAVAGHSLGEVTAACVAGILDLPTAAAFVAARGEAMQACPVGAMLAVGCDADTARRLAAGLDLEVATVSGPDSCVLAGDPDAVAEMQRRVGERLFTRRLRTTRAFHSRLVDPAVADLATALHGVTPHPAAVPLVRGADGRVVPVGGQVHAADFAGDARRPVRLDAVLTTLATALPAAVALEIGPGRTLSAAAEAAGLTTFALSGGTGAARVRPSSGAPGPDGDDPVLACLGALWTVGQPVDPALGAGGRRIRLPGHVFAGPRWVAAEITDPLAVAGNPALGEAAPGGTPGRPDAGSVVRRAWADLLGREDLGDESDFFQLGGDSLLITRLAHRVNSELGVRVPIRAMLAGRTLGRQVAVVAETVAADRPG